jgi:hypothetical protein
MENKREKLIIKRRRRSPWREIKSFFVLSGSLAGVFGLRNEAFVFFFYYYYYYYQAGYWGDDLNLKWQICPCGSCSYTNETWPVVVPMSLTRLFESLTGSNSVPSRVTGFCNSLPRLLFLLLAFPFIAWIAGEGKYHIGITKVVAFVNRF